MYTLVHIKKSGEAITNCFIILINQLWCVCACACVCVCVNKNNWVLPYNLRGLQ